MNKLLGIIVIAAGLALSALWIFRDPGWTAVFRRSAIIIGFIPIPGVLFGFLMQLIPAIGGLIGGLALWNRQS